MVCARRGARYRQDISHGLYQFLGLTICEDNFQASLNLVNNEDFFCLPCSICDSNSETYLTGVKCGAYLTGIYDVKFEDHLTVI